MKKTIGVALVLLLASLALSGCGHHHHYRDRRAEGFHRHRLDCGHLVGCNFYGRKHQYKAHKSHERYYHLHRGYAGRYDRCYVVRGRHRGY